MGQGPPQWSPDGRWRWDGTQWVEASAPAKEPEVTVKTYRSARDYERDAKRMVAAGWAPQGQLTSQGRVRVGRTVGKAVVFLPWAMFRPSRRADRVTVTWVRRSGP